MDSDTFYPSEVSTIVVYKPTISTYNPWISYKEPPILKIFSGIAFNYRVFFAKEDPSLFDDPSKRTESNWYDSGWLTAGMSRTRIYPVKTPSGDNVFPYRYDFYQMPEDVFNLFREGRPVNVYVRVVSARGILRKSSSLTDSDGNVHDFRIILSPRGGTSGPGGQPGEPGGGCGGCSTGGGAFDSFIFGGAIVLYFYLKIRSGKP